MTRMQKNHYFQCLFSYSDLSDNKPPNFDAKLKHVPSALKMAITEQAEYLTTCKYSANATVSSFFPYKQMSEARQETKIFQVWSLLKPAIDCIAIERVNLAI